MGKNIGKYISINLSGKYTRDILDYAKQSATNAFKTFSKKKKKKKRIKKYLKMSMITKNLKKDYISRRKTGNYWRSEINITV